VRLGAAQQPLRVKRTKVPDCREGEKRMNWFGSMNGLTARVQVFPVEFTDVKI
jgi:hypothetical protein